MIKATVKQSYIINVKCLNEIFLKLPNVYTIKAPG